MTDFGPRMAKGLKDYEYPQIAERFYRETQHHRLTILRDDGLYRHLRMMPPKDKSSCYWYDIVTWPGNLVFRGDGETFAFSRIEDMFALFRSGWYRDKIHINPTYWSEKLTSNRDCVMGYDEEKFQAYVADILQENEEQYPGLTAAWEDAIGDFTADYDISSEEGAWEALHNFSYGEEYIARCVCGSASEPKRTAHDAYAWAREDGHGRHMESPGLSRPGHMVTVDHTFPFTFDASEANFKDYDWWFLWSLYGIVRAIVEYDRVKGVAGPVDVSQVGREVCV